MFIDVQTFSYFVSSSFSVPSQFLPSSFPVPSQFLPSYFPKLIRAKVHDGNSEGRLHWYKFCFKFFLSSFPAFFDLFYLFKYENNFGTSRLTEPSHPKAAQAI